MAQRDSPRALVNAEQILTIVLFAVVCSMSASCDGACQSTSGCIPTARLVIASLRDTLAGTTIEVSVTAEDQNGNTVATQS